MIGSRSLSGLFLLVFLISVANGSTSYPTPIQPDPTYQTGISNIITASFSSSSLFTVTYNWAMSTASLNGSLAIAGMSYQFDNNQNGWQQYIISLNASALIMNVSVSSNSNPITNMRISYLVSSSQFLDINYVSLTFSTLAII